MRLVFTFFLCMTLGAGDAASQIRGPHRGLFTPTGPTPTKIQIKAATPQFSGTSRAFTYTSNVTNTNVSVISIMTNQTISSVNGSTFGAYTSMGSAPGPTGYTKYLYCKAATSTASETVTVTIASAGVILVGGEEWSNTQCVADGSSTNGPVTSGGPWSSGAVTGTHGTDVYFCMYSDGSATGSPYTFTNGFTGDYNVNTQFQIGTKVLTSNVSTDCTGTLGASQTWTVYQILLKGA